jgi:hypothetical protein
MSKKQTIAIGLMAAIGLLLAVLMLMPKREARSASEAEHADGPQEEIVKLDDAQAKAAGVVLTAASPAKIGTAITLPGWRWQAPPSSASASCGRTRSPPSRIICRPGRRSTRQRSRCRTHARNSMLMAPALAAIS